MSTPQEQKLTWAPRTFNQSVDSAGWVAISYPVFPNIWLGTGGGTTLVDNKTFYPISRGTKNMTWHTFLLSSLLLCHSSWSTSSAGWNTTYRMKIRQRTTKDAWPNSRPWVNVHPVWGGTVGIVDSCDMTSDLSCMILARHNSLHKVISWSTGSRHNYLISLYIPPRLCLWARSRAWFSFLFPSLSSPCHQPNNIYYTLSSILQYTYIQQHQQCLTNLSPLLLYRTLLVSYLLFW